MRAHTKMISTTQRRIPRVFRLTIILMSSVGAMEVICGQEQRRVQSVQAAKEYALTANVQESRRVSLFFDALAFTARNSGQDLSGDISTNTISGEGFRSPFLEDIRFNDNAFYMLNLIEPRVWNGKDAEDGQFMEAVYVYGGFGICSAVLIASDKVLTASHCVCDRRTSYVRVGTSVSNYVQEFIVSETAMMPLTCADNRRGQDIAVLTLSTSTTLTPARIANYGNLGDFRQATVVGFGAAGIDRPSGVKRYGDIVVVSAHCSGFVEQDGALVPDQDYYDCVPGQELVAGSPAWLTDSCGGDSGGPLYHVADDGTRLLVGITSREVRTHTVQRCGNGGVYTRLDNRVMRWLESQGL